MNKSFSKIRHIQESNILLERRSLQEKNDNRIMEQNSNSAVTSLKPKLDRYVTAVKNAIPGYESALGFEQKTDGGTIFGSVIYNLPLQFPKDQSKVLSNLQKIRNTVLGANDPSKKLQYTCLPKINSKFTGQFSDPICTPYNTQLNSDNIVKYKEMNAAYDDLYKFLSTTSPTQS